MLNGTPVTIVGVMPAGFYFPSRDAEFWRPIALNTANASRGAVSSASGSLAAAAISVLLVLLLSMNALAIWLRDRFQKKLA